MNPSALEHADFLREEFAEFIERKFWVVLPYDVTYILDTLQYDLRRRVPEQGSERSVLGHVDQGHLEQDPFVQSHGDQARLSIPDSVCSDYDVTYFLLLQESRVQGIEGNC